jgi:CHASE2 domain-containing sensor protein
MPQGMESADPPPEHGRGGHRAAPPKPKRRRRRPLARNVRRHAGRFTRTLRQTLVSIHRTVTAVERSHYRRFILSFIAGLVVLGAMRIPWVNESAFGEPDRQMMEMAFKIRADLIHGGDPALLVDIDDDTIASVRDTTGPPRAPAATAPRMILANVLEYIRTSPAQQAPQVVVMDVDLATPTPGDEAGAVKLHQVLADWAKTPSAPPLILARQSFPASLMGGQPGALILPATDFDDVVTPAPNIYWGNVKMMADQNSVVREFLPYECVVGPDGKTSPLYSASLLAYGFLQQGRIPQDAPVRQWMERAEPDCRGGTHVPILHGELINYHLSLGKGENARVWPELLPTWKGFSTCGPGTDTAIFRRLSAADIAAAGPDADHGIICQRMVVIGGTNAAASDFEQTPLNEMAGPVIIVNSARGLELSNGGLKRVPLFVQLTVLFVVSAMITTGFWITRKIRENYLHLKSRHEKQTLAVRLRLLPFNPVVLNFVFAFAAHWFGVGLLLLSLNLGYWGYLSASAFASAAVGAMQEFADDEP